MRYVIKIGGSLIQDKKTGKLNIALIKEIASVLRKIYEEDNSVGIVVGGGKTAREYIKAARVFSASEAYCDEIGIEASRLNAKIFISALGNIAYPEPALSFREAVDHILKKKIVVMGGTQPGQSTNAVAAILSEYLNADLFVNATDVDGVYSFSQGKKVFLSEISSEDLYKILENKESSAGTYPLFDILALKIISRSNIPTVILNGNNPENILKVVMGEKIGTRITFKS